MALYWPNKKVALDIVDDPQRRPFEGDDSYTVLRVTTADLCNYDSYCKVIGHLESLLGDDSFEMPSWEDDSLDSIEILATSKSEGEIMAQNARMSGREVRGVCYWDGPIPPDSFEEIGPCTRMSTPEYFFYRKANELSLPQAAWLGVELCGRFRTSVTQRTRVGGYDYLKKPRTTRADIRQYLRGAHGTKEGKRARKVLRYLQDDCSSPMGCYLYLLLCLPRSHGGYGLERPLLGAAFAKDDGYVPRSDGKYLAYDLCWLSKRVAMQYTGEERPSSRHLTGLATEGMRVACMTDDIISNSEHFDAEVRKLAETAGFELPEPTDKWLDARDRLRDQIEMPTFPKMRLIANEMMEHLAED